MESNEVHSLIALAEAGHGIAVVPSTVRFTSRKIRMMPIVQAEVTRYVERRGVGFAPVLAGHGEAFIAELEAYTRRTFRASSSTRGTAVTKATGP